jgi:hypothetical protein
VGVGAVAAYLTIKHKGVMEERARQAEAQAKAQLKLQQELNKARSMDSAIDSKVEDEIKAINQKHSPKPDSSDKFKF